MYNVHIYVTTNLQLPVSKLNPSYVNEMDQTNQVQGYLSHKGAIYLEPFVLRILFRYFSALLDVLKIRYATVQCFKGVTLMDSWSRKSSVQLYSCT